MSPDASALLQKLKASGGYPLSDAPIGAVTELVNAGLVDQRTPKTGKDRTPKLYLTQLGTAEKKRLGVAKTPRAARAAKPSALTLADLEQWSDALEQRLVRAISSAVSSSAASCASSPAKSIGGEPDDAVLAAQLAATHSVLAPTWRRLVPIPVLRKQFPGISPKTWDRLVLELERKGTFDLKVANDPSTVADPELGIRIPERGLLYFVVAI